MNIKYDVEGMSCAACVAHVEKAVKGVDGVDGVSVSLLTNSMVVEGAAAPGAVCDAVERAGYHAAARGNEENKRSDSPGEDFLDRETPLMVRRLILSVVFLLPLMYVSMGHMMWGWPLPPFLEENHIGMGLYEMILAFVVMCINKRFFESGTKSALHGAPNMDTLVALGSGVSFGYSTIILFAMTYASSRGDAESVMRYMDEFYFESAAMIVTLITVGKTLESYSKGRTADALRGLLELAPKMANVIRDGKELTIPAAEVMVGDVFIVRPGEAFPVDGIVTKGASAVDESALTGESIPVDKAVGDEVAVGTISVSGFLTCKAIRVGCDTILSRIVELVSEAAASKAPIAKAADRVAGVFVPVVLGIAFVTALVWLILGAPVGTALGHAITVLVISCPCALGLATPVAVMVGSGIGAKNGILYKNAVSLEQAGRADIVVMDKTGTITAGTPVVTDVIASEGIDERKLLFIAASLEAKSEHPLSKAVMEYANASGVVPGETFDFSSHAGSGISARFDGIRYFAGKRDYIEGELGKEVDFFNKCNYESFLSEGKTPLIFASESGVIGVIFVADTIKPDSRTAIEELKAMGIYTVMLTGDNQRTAAAMGALCGVDEVIADVLPDGKEAVIRSLQSNGRVIMVGDGINDAPALTRADVGFAIGAGSDIAIDAADVVLVNSSLSDVSAAIRLSKQVLKNIHENLFWAFIYNIIGIPLAAGVWIPITGWSLSPMFGAAAMSLSSICVVTNALRLNLFDIRRSDRFLKKAALFPREKMYNQITKEKGGNSTMEKTLNIDGMMCEKCEAHVKKALEAMEGVGEVVEVSHDKGVAVVKLTKEVLEDAFKAAVDEAGYEYKGVA